MSLKLYYTKADAFLQPQPNPLNSIGGYISSSLIPNGLINNLFGDVTQNADPNIKEVRAIALKNETGTDLTNFSLWFVYPTDPLIKLEIAIVQPAEDACGDLYMEKLITAFSTPYVGTFYEADGPSNSLMIGNFPQDTYFGLWIRRTVRADTLADNKSCDVLHDRFLQNIVPDTFQNIQLIFDWT